MQQPSPELQALLMNGLLIAGGVSLLADFVIFILWLVSYNRESVGKPPLLSKHWSLADVFIGGQIAIGLVVLASIGLVAKDFSAFISNPDPNLMMRTMLVPSVIIQNVVLALVVLAFVVFRYHIRTRRFLNGRRPIRGFLIGLAVGVPAVALVLMIGELNLLAPLERALRQTHFGKMLIELQAVMDPTKLIIEMVKKPLGFFWILLSVGIITPIGEEVFFRGFLFNALKHRFGLIAGIFFSSLLFAIIHLQVINFLPMVGLAFILAYVYHRTGTLWSCIAIHALNNSLVVILAHYAPHLAK